MSEQTVPAAPGGEPGPALPPAGARRRSATSGPVDQVDVLRRRSRRAGVVAVAAVAVAALLGGLLLDRRSPGTEAELASAQPRDPGPGGVERLLASLDAEPVDPAQVELVSSVSTFPDCDALVGDLRQMGAEHVGSRGFGASSDVFLAHTEAEEDATTAADASVGRAAAAEPTTLGTNVQVTGVDELDFVKAVGTLIFDLDGKGNLRITDAVASRVLSTLDVTPPGPGSTGGDSRWRRSGGDTQVAELLVADGQVVIFGTEVEVAAPVEGDPSATRPATAFMTVTFVDATDPATPAITDRVRVEGSLVSARLVDGEVRLVTTSNMADLGFVLPTTPSSVVKALEQNRRSVASSTAADWIPDWQRTDEEPEPLVPCDRVHVPDTFSGVAMTSMVTFPLGTGRFEPAGTSILAPATTLYAGLDRVAVSSEVWVDPVDRDRLDFEDWQTAIHELSFTEGAAPTYTGSGIVDGSTIGQFAFGEIGSSLAVVTTEGTPWQRDPTSAVDLTILTPDGEGGLTQTAQVSDLAAGKGEVSAVRFLDGRVLISTGFFGREVYVVDVTQPAEPRRAGSLTLPGTVGYFHPLPDHQALLVGSRADEVGEGEDRQSRSWVQAQLLDISDPDAPSVLSTWERPWVADDVGQDHHAFTYWPDRRLAMWGLRSTQWDRANANMAAVLRTEGGLVEVAVPVASKPDETPPPCPTFEVTDAVAREMVGSDSVVLRCVDHAVDEVEWPRFQCYRVEDATVARFVPGEEGGATFHLCSPAPPPVVGRVLVVSGIPMLLTDQTLEALDPETLRSTSVTYHPSGGRYGF